MNISQKIEEIRQKPEHIRLRYVWGSVAISMIFIIIIWVFSFSESFKKKEATSGADISGIKQSMEDLKSVKDSVPSINEITKNAQTINNQLQKNPATPTN
ncbi:MAG: hypothetical protein V1804_04775 [Patescibacteria group bacterium]